MDKFQGTNLLDFKRELLKDDRERLEYYRLKPKYDLIQIIIERRIALKLSQEQLANIVGMKQPAISRLENNVNDVKIGTLFKVMDALDLSLEIKPREKTSV
jgi:HTH-type transcriptional regulator / antitoxin HipB